MTLTSLLMMGLVILLDSTVWGQLYDGYKINTTGSGGF